MIKKVLIVDDSELDRKSFRKTFCRIIPDVQILEAPNIGKMYNMLGPDVDLLVQDISLNEHSKSDSSGLNALYDVAEYYPGIPFAILTGHYYEKVKEFHSGFLVTTKNFAGYYDKSDFSKNDVEKMALLADDKKTAFLSEQEVQNRLNDLQKRGEQLEMQLRQREKEDSAVGQAGLYQQAFMGKDLAQCIVAEGKVTGGNANYSAYRICNEIEKVVKKLVVGSPVEKLAFFQKVQYIQETKSLTDDIFYSVNDAWVQRNALIHDQKCITVRGAMKLFDVYGLLTKISFL